MIGFKNNNKKTNKKQKPNLWVWWPMCVIPAFGKYEAGVCEFEANLGHIVAFKIKHKYKKKPSINQPNNKQKDPSSLTSSRNILVKYQT